MDKSLLLCRLPSSTWRHWDISPFTEGMEVPTAVTTREAHPNTCSIEISVFPLLDFLGSHSEVIFG